MDIENKTTVIEDTATVSRFDDVKIELNSNIDMRLDYLVIACQIGVIYTGTHMSLCIIMYYFFSTNSYFSITYYYSDKENKYRIPYQ